MRRRSLALGMLAGYIAFDWYRDPVSLMFVLAAVALTWFVFRYVWPDSSSSWAIAKPIGLVRFLDPATAPYRTTWTSGPAYSFTVTS